MRDIKFRAWVKDGTGNKMVDLKSITPLALVPNLGIDGLFLPFKENTILMQYTGLKDKNGTEIYEGDIYHQGDRNILYVVEYTQDCSFMGRQIRTKGSYAGLSYWRDRIEVIGNIYANPEVLEAN